MLQALGRLLHVYFHLDAGTGPSWWLKISISKITIPSLRNEQFCEFVIELVEAVKVAFLRETSGELYAWRRRARGPKGARTSWKASGLELDACAVGALRRELGEEMGVLPAGLRHRLEAALEESSESSASVVVAAMHTTTFLAGAAVLAVGVEACGTGCAVRCLVLAVRCGVGQLLLLLLRACEAQALPQAGAPELVLHCTASVFWVLYGSTRPWSASAFQPRLFVSGQTLL